MVYGFKTAYDLFEHALLKNTSHGIRRKSIYVKCPRCGRIGRLISYSKNFLGRKYKVLHYPPTQMGCSFGPTSEGHDYLEEIYNKYRKLPETGSGDKWRLYEFMNYLLNVEGYKRSTAYTVVYLVRKILSKYGKFKKPEELREFLRTNTNYSCHMVYKCVHAYRAYLRFKQWKSECNPLSEVEAPLS